MKKLWFLVFLTLIPAAIFAQQQTETINISSYYPSPYGIYKTLRFYPNDNYDATQNPSCANAGEIYYDKSENTLYACSGTPLSWQRFGKGGFFYAPFGSPGYQEITVPWDEKTFKEVDLAKDGLVPASARFAAIYVYSPEDKQFYLTFADMSGNIFGKIGDHCNTTRGKTSIVSGHQHEYDQGGFGKRAAGFVVIPLTKGKLQMNLGRSGSGSGKIRIYRLGYIE